MNKSGWILISIIAFLTVTTISISNGLNQKEEAVFNALGNLDSCLQRRYDLIPNLVSTVKGYAAHESNTLQAVIEARSQATKITLDSKLLNDESAMATFAKRQGELQSAMQKLMVVVESYPNLQANKNFLDLQHQLEGTENRINYSRNQLNETVRIFNTSIRSFPASLLNSIFGQLEKKLFFKADEKAATAPTVSFEK